MPLSSWLPFLLSIVLCRTFTTTAASNDGGCDETQCRASFPFPPERTNPNSYGYYSNFDRFCWSPNLASVDDPGNCQDGYKPVPLPDANPLPGFEGEDYVYFTCCPLDYSANDTELALVVNQCDSTFGACRDDTLDCVIGTSYGFFDAVICDPTSDYPYPNLVAKNGTLLLFACCQTDDGSVEQTYVWTAALKLTVVSWLILSIVVLLFLSLLVASMMSSRFVRNQSYNLYIFFLAVPDLILNATMIVLSAMVLANVKWDVNDAVTYINGSVWLANMWINTVVSYEVYRMVMRSQRRVRTDPPSTTRICLQCGVVYVASLVLMWLATSGVEGSNPTIYLMATIGLLLFAAIPFVFIPFATYRIYKTGLLSTTGRTRVMAVFFGKIVLIFFCFSLPSVGITVSSGFNEYTPDMTYWETPVSYQLTILQ